MLIPVDAALAGAGIEGRQARREGAAGEALVGLTIAVVVALVADLELRLAGWALHARTPLAHRNRPCAAQAPTPTVHC